jgi:hypothetical protein
MRDRGGFGSSSFLPGPLSLVMSGSAPPTSRSHVLFF